MADQAAGLVSASERVFVTGLETSSHAALVGSSHQTSRSTSNSAQLAEQVADVLRREGEIAAVAELAHGRRVYAAAADPNEATALEQTIQAREAAYAWVDSLSLEQFPRGPAVAVNSGDVTALVHMSGAASIRTREVAAVLAAIGATL